MESLEGARMALFWAQYNAEHPSTFRAVLEGFGELVRRANGPAMCGARLHRVGENVIVESKIHLTLKSRTVQLMVTVPPPERFQVFLKANSKPWLRARPRSPRTLYLNSRMVTPMSEHMGYDTFLKGNCTWNEASKVPNLASIATSQENS